MFKIPFRPKNEPVSDKHLCSVQCDRGSVIPTWHVRLVSSTLPRRLFCGLLLTLLSGCGASRVPGLLNQQEPLDNNLEEEILADTASISPAQFSEDVSIDELLAQAKEACAGQVYSRADSLLRAAINHIEIEAGYIQSEWFPADDYIGDVIGMYTQLMPPEFPVPDDITMLMFQRQLQRSLDTLKITTDDSIRLAKLSCSKEITYDVPIAWNSRVQRSVLLYMGSRKQVLERWLQRANYYLPVIKQMFADSGLPQDLSYLPLIESGFNSLAYSRAHASGMWQFIPSTGKVYGLRQNYWLDERRDPIKATSAAINYLKKLYRDFNHWHLALAAYNCGEGGLGRAIKRNETNDYWQLTLPKETMNYVPQYLASVMVAKNPDCFGYSPSASDTFLLDTVSVSDCIDMNDIAQGTGIDPDTLRRINPHILHWCTPPDMADIRLYLPRGHTQAFLDFYAALPAEKKVRWFRYRIRRGDNISTIARQFRIPAVAIKSVNRMKSNKIVSGKYLFIPIATGNQIPAAVSASAEHETAHRRPSGAPGEGGSNKIKYRVRKGDNLWKLSELFGTSPSEISRWNNLSSTNTIKAGDILVIYRKGSQPSVRQSPGKTTAGSYVVRKGDTPGSIAQQVGMSVTDLMKVNSIDPNRPIIRPGDVLVYGDTGSRPEVRNQPSSEKVAQTDMISYVVASGDNLFRISQNFSVTLDALRRANGFSENSIIRAGDTLKIPVAEGKAAGLNLAAAKEEASVTQQQSVSPTDQHVTLYEIKTGDNLWRIASAFGISVEMLYRENGLSADSVLMPGDTIKVIQSRMGGM